MLRHAAKRARYEKLVPLRPEEDGRSRISWRRTRPMVTDPESSVELLERARAGDSDALDRLLGRYLPRLRRWASGRLPRRARDLSDTDDLVQERYSGR